MSKVTQVTVLYGRKIQPKKYEEKHGLLEAVVVAEENEVVTQEELIAVFENLVNRVHVALGLEEDTPVGNSVDEPAKKTTRTRRTKKQIADDKAEAEKPADEVPVEGDETVEAPESVEESIETDGGVSDTDLQGAAARAAAAHGTAVVKGLIKEFNIMRLAELSQDQRVAFLVKLDELGS